MRYGMRRGVVTVLTATMCAALVLSACGSSKKSPSASAPAQSATSAQSPTSSAPQTLKIMVLNPLIATNYLDVLANHLGYFQQNGINAQLVTTTDPITPLIAGDVNVANVGANGILAIVKDKQTSFKFLMSPFKTPQLALMVRKGSSLTAKAHQWPGAVTELNGLTLGTTVPDGEIQQAGQYMVSLAGPAAKGVKVVPAGNASTLVAGLQKGNYDAALVPSPLFEELEAQGQATSILDIYKGEGPPAGALDVAWLNQMVTGSFYESHKDLLYAYQRAYQEAIDYARNPANTTTMTDYLASVLKKDPSQIQAGIQTFIETLNQTAQYSQSQWSASNKMMIANGVLTQPLSYSQYVIPWHGGS